MATKKKPLTMKDTVEHYLVQHKKMAVGDLENTYGIRPDQVHRVVYDLRKQGYPITSKWVSCEDDPDVHFVLYSIPHNWSKKSLNK